ncbi:NACHT domain-containing protein [Streptomyces sp. NPDC002886]|uniref:NACHT domain-containing protein n=1 Tax=Streptomyces sp. NPDC002886 TaxID=3364667 RepID=UPI003680B18B
MLVGAGVVVLLVLLGLGVGGGFGAGDPVASVVGGLAGVGALVLGWRQWRAQGPESDPDAVAVRLARKVAVVEQRALRALLGGDLEGVIDVGFDVEAVGAVDLPAVPPGGWGVAGIASFYRQVEPGRLVIIGSGTGRGWDTDAGAGKTVAAVTLCADLAQGHRDRPGPVPVRLSAASWSGGSLEEWLQEQLVGVWRLRPREAAAVIEAQLVLPVIDGVDEMDRDPSPGLSGAVVAAESRAAALLNMVTAYAPGPVVLTCRTRHYAALADVGKEVRRTAVLTLLPVTGAQAAAYLEDRVAYNPRHYARWLPVLEALTRAPVPGALQDAGTAGLRTALTNPWRLTLAALVYQDTDPATGTLRDPARLLAYAAAGTLQAHLLDGFVTAAIHAHAPRLGQAPPDTARHARRQDPEATWRYLAVLAAHLDDNAPTPQRPARTVAGQVLSASDITLHRLWPLAGERRVLRCHAAGGIAAAAVSCLPALVMIWIGSDAQARALTAALVGVVLAGLAALAVASAAKGWPELFRLNPGGLRTVEGLLYGILMIECMSGITLFITFGMFHAYGIPVGRGPLFGVSSGVGLVIGLAFAVVRDGGDARALGPLDRVRLALAASLVFGLVLVLTLVCTAALGFLNRAGLASVIVVLTTGALAPCLMAGLFISGVPWRYGAFLVCMQGRLPWRLGRFLHRCERLGILRVAGDSWQFRHAELQHHLATRPQLPAAPW